MRRSAASKPIIASLVALAAVTAAAAGLRADPPAMVKEVPVKLATETKDGWTVLTNASKILAADVTPDKKTIWCATSGGALAFDVAKETFTKYTSVDGLCGNNLRDVAVTDDGAVWFVGGSGVTRLDPKTMKTERWGRDRGLPFLGASSIGALKDAVYVGTKAGGYTCGPERKWAAAKPIPTPVKPKLAGSGFKLIPRGGGLAKGFVIYVPKETNGMLSNFVSSSAVAEDGALWVSFGKGGAARLAKDGKWTTWPATKKGMTANRIAVGPGGKVYAAGAKVWGCDGKRWVVPEGLKGAGLKWVWAIFTDSKGVMWVGNVSWDGKKVTKYPFGGTFGFDEAPDGAVWVGARGGGVFKIVDGKVAGNWKAADGIVDARKIHSLGVGPDGTVWAGAKKGLSRFDGKKWTSFTYPKDKDKILDHFFEAIVRDPRGNTWFGTKAGGISVLDSKGKWSQLTPDNSPVPCRFIYDIKVTPPEGAVLIAGWGGGFARFEPPKK